MLKKVRSNSILAETINLLLSWAIDYLVVTLLIYLICLCFELEFTFKISTGMWLSLMLLNLNFRNFNNRK